MRFRDRVHAGRELARLLAPYAHRPDVIVLGLPRGGMPVAAEVARALGVPFDVFLVRKLGVPGHEELAFGAIAQGGVQVLNDALVVELDLPPSAVSASPRASGLSSTGATSSTAPDGPSPPCTIGPSS